MPQSALENFLSHYPETVLRAFSDCARERGHDIFLVGGALRDLMMNVVSADLDFAINGGAAAYIGAVRDRLGRGSIVILGDREMDTARLVLEELALDVSGFRLGAATIDEDLVRRDFTINSLAVSLEDLLSPDGEVVPIDPLGGFIDLKAGLIRACPGCFDDDPLRLLRAYRFGAQLGFTIHRDSLDQIREKGGLIDTVAAERISSELDLIMATPRAFQTFQAMRQTDLLRHLIPELYQGDGIDQPPFHHLDVMSHNLATLDLVERIIARPRLHFPRSHELIVAVVEDPKSRSTLKWAALFHDIGKPAARSAGGSSPRQITFYNHDGQGAEIAVRIGERWKWSRRKNRRIAGLVAMHMHPFHLGNVMRSGQELSRRALLKLCKRAGEDLVPLFLLAMADSLAGQGPDKPPQMEEQLEQLLLEVAAFRRERLEPAAARPKLLTGSDLMAAFALPPGPEIGRLLEALEEAAIDGQVGTREEALAWVEGRLQGR